MSSRATEQHPLGLLAVAGTVVCWGVGNLMVRDIDLPALQLAFWRLALSASDLHAGSRWRGGAG